MEDNSAYFDRRAKEERIAAMKSAHPGARRAHVEMAERYDALAGAAAQPIEGPKAAA